MKFWDDIKIYFYRRRLEQDTGLVKVEHALISLEGAHTMGIIFTATNPILDEAILKFAGRLRSEGKEVELLAYVNDKKTESKPGITVFNRKHLNWVDVPQNEQVEKFTRKKFDLLLACFTGDNLPLEYIAGVSNARWRVGIYAENKTGLYDMMVNMGGRKDLAYFLEQTAYFLNYIKAA